VLFQNNDEAQKNKEKDERERIIAYMLYDVVLLLTMYVGL